MVGGVNDWWTEPMALQVEEGHVELELGTRLEGMANVTVTG